STSDSFVLYYVSPVQEFKQLETGSQWFWTIGGVNQYDFLVFYQPHKSPEFWEQVIETIQLADGYRIVYYDGVSFAEDKLDSYSTLESTQTILPAPSSLGYFVEKSWLALKLDRPSVTITDNRGEALRWAESFKLEYAPIVIKNEPAPT